MNKSKYFRVTHETTPEQLKKQYRELCFIHHPDKTGGDHSIFAEINIEYHTLLKQLSEKPGISHIKQSTILFEIESHLQRILQHVQAHQDLYSAIYNEIKQPLLSVFPGKYQDFISDFIELIEKYTNKKTS